MSGPVTRSLPATLDGAGEASGLLRAVLVAAVLILVIPVLLMASLPVPAVSEAVAVLWIVVAWGGVRLGMLARRGQPELISLSFWLYVYVWLGLTPMLQASQQSFPWPGAYGGGLVLQGAAVVCIGLLGYEAGVKLAGAYVPRSLMSFACWRISYRRIFLGTVVSVLLGVVLVARIGGLRDLLLSRVQFARELKASSGGAGQAGALLLHALLKVPPFVVGIAYLRLLVNNYVTEGTRRRASSWVGAVLIVLNILVNNPLTAFRAWFGTVVLSVVFVGAKWRSWVSSVTLIFGLVAVLIFIFPYSDVFRLAVAVRLTGLKVTSPSEQLVQNGDYSSFQQVLNAEVYVREHGVTMGRQLVGSLLVFVPRRIWQHKPVDTADLVAGNIGYQYKNLEMPLWGEFLVDWGMVGVLIGFLAYGWVSRSLECLYLSRLRDTSLITVLVPIYAGYQFFVLRGDLMSAIGWWLPVAGVLLLLTTPLPRQSS